MDRSEIAKRAKEILVEGLRLEIEPEDIVDSEAIFGEGLGLDSIDALEFVVLVEEEFDIAVPSYSSALNSFLTPNAVCCMLSSKDWQVERAVAAA